jgi:hypothetical protein
MATDNEFQTSPFKLRLHRGGFPLEAHEGVAGRWRAVVIPVMSRKKDERDN